MQAASFVRGLPPLVVPRLPAALADPRRSVGGSMLKLWYGNKDLHYECWIRQRLGVVEVGLHFESGALTNLRLLGAFRARERTIAKRLEGARIEEWDRGWARVWEPVPLGSLDEALQARLAERMARYVRVLEPILEAELPADVRWTK